MHLIIAQFFIFPVIHITTCGNTGRTGPNSEQCNEEYNRTDIELVTPSPEEDPLSFNLNGIQRWIAPRGGYYT